MSPAEAAYQLGSTYSEMLPAELRARHGIFHTPPALAERLLDQAESAGTNWRTARILDPAAGFGAFLIPAARRMAAAAARANPTIAYKNIGVRLRGWEIDPFAAWLANVFVFAELQTVIPNRTARSPTFVEARDSLTTVSQLGTFELVIGNPPFGRQRLASSTRKRFARSLYGHANLYGIFLDLAVRLASRKGLVSFLTPASFLAGEYFKNLRATLWREAPPLNIDFVAARKGIFDGVLQETVLATYRCGGERKPIAVHFLEGRSDHRLQLRAAGNFVLPGRPSEPWILPRHIEDVALADRLEHMPHRLADWGYRVSTGPLVWNRHKLQLRDRAEDGCLPLIWAESVTSDGQFHFRCEKRNHKPYFMPLRGDDWLIVDTPCVLLQRTTAKEQARRLIAAEMPRRFIAKHGGVTVENHLNMLIPSNASPAVPPALLTAFLNTAIVDRAFRCISGSVAVSAYELESLPVPSPALISRFKNHLTSCLNRNEIEREIARLYGHRSR
jgi:adenine-specific DNA-methyltransferase